MLKKITLLLSLLFFTASCRIFADSMPDSWNWGFKPRPLTAIRGFPSTDTFYGMGFKDGCASGWAAVSKGLLSDINGKKFDYKAWKKNSDYNIGWWDGYEQCTYSLDWDVT